MDVGVERAIVAGGSIDEADGEAIHAQRFDDALAQLLERAPHQALLLHVEIVEGRHMAARGYSHMAGADGVGVRQGDGKLRQDPGVIHRNRAIGTGRQTIL